jgi:hypothetical protein
VRGFQAGELIGPLVSKPLDLGVDDGGACVRHRGAGVGGGDPRLSVIAGLPQGLAHRLGRRAVPFRVGTGPFRVGLGRGDLSRRPVARLRDLPLSVRRDGSGLLLCPLGLRVRARLRGGDLLPCLLSRFRGRRFRGRLDCLRLRAYAVSAILRVPDSPQQQAALALELTGPLGERALGELGVRGELFGCGVGIFLEPEGLVTHLFGLQLSAPGTGGLLAGLRDIPPGLEADRGDLQVEGRRVAHDG